VRYGTKEDVIRRLARKQIEADPDAADPRSGLAEDVLLKLDMAYRKADAYLQELADSSGGVLEYADSLADLKPALQRIAKELRQQYLLAYYPSNRDKSRATRRINVDVLRPGAKVRARPAYTL
jgi:hypothetical protein